MSAVGTLHGGRQQFTDIIALFFAGTGGAALQSDMIAALPGLFLHDETDLGQGCVHLLPLQRLGEEQILSGPVIAHKQLVGGDEYGEYAKSLMI